MPKHSTCLMVQAIKGNIEVSKLLAHAGTSLDPERHQGTAHMAQCYLGTGGQQWAQEVLHPHMHRAGCGVHMEPHSREKGWEYPGFLMLQTAQLEKYSGSCDISELGFSYRSCKSFILSSLIPLLFHRKAWKWKFKSYSEERISPFLKIQLNSFLKTH